MNAKRHHYVPEAYLKEFCAEDGKITVYRKVDPVTPFRVSPSNIALERYYYASTREDGTRDTDTLEQLFSQIESGWPEVISALSRGDNSAQITHDLLQFTCLQRARVPALRDAYELMRADFVIHMAKLLKRLGKLPELPAGTEDIFDRLEVSVDPESSLHAIGITLEGMMERVLPSVGFTIIHNETKIDFITSDNPVMWFVPYKKQGLIRPYELRAGAPIEFLFPLTPRMLLVGMSDDRARFNSNGLLHADISDVSAVKRTNRFSAKFAYRLLLAKDSSPAALATKYAQVSPVIQTTAFPSSDGQTVMGHMEFSGQRKKARWKLPQ